MKKQQFDKDTFETRVISSSSSMRSFYSNKGHNVRYDEIDRLLMDLGFEIRDDERGRYRREINGMTIDVSYGNTRITFTGINTKEKMSITADSATKIDAKRANTYRDKLLAIIERERIELQERQQKYINQKKQLEFWNGFVEYLLCNAGSYRFSIKNLSFSVDADGRILLEFRLHESVFFTRYATIRLSKTGVAKTIILSGSSRQESIDFFSEDVAYRKDVLNLALYCGLCAENWIESNM